MNPARFVRTVAIAALVGAVGAATACGLEDPKSIATRRGALQLAYPNALHVGTAVWQAQMAGTLPRDALAQRGDLSPEARASLRLIKANALIARLADRVNARASTDGRPGVAIVLIGPVMWSRFASGTGPARAQIHVEGPEQDDVVVVTDLAVVEAIAKGTIDVTGAIEAGVMRLYGSPEPVVDAQSWLSGGMR